VKKLFKRPPRDQLSRLGNICGVTVEIDRYIETFDENMKIFVKKYENYDKKYKNYGKNMKISRKI